MHAQNKPTDLRPVKQSAQPPSGGTPLRSRGTASPRYNSASLIGRSPPLSEVPSRSRVSRPLERDSASLGGLDPPLAQGPASIEGRAPPRASFRLARGNHGLAASTPAPPAGASNALTFAGTKSKVNPRHYAPGNHDLALLHQLPWRGHPRHCATLCSVVSNRPAAPYHPLPYGRRTAP
jgi:hypothetical protein